MSTVAVTGGNGFVGRYLTRELEQAGDTVIVLDRNTGFDVTDRQSVRSTLADAKPEFVYHLAAFTHVGDSWDAPVEVMRVNVEGTLNVLDAARAVGVRRALIVGSAEEYGQVDPSDVPLTEDAPLRPKTPYGASKVAAGFLALQAWLGSGFETIRVRPFNHTGAGQLGRFLVPALARRIAIAERDALDSITVGNLDPIRELLDVRDVVRAYRLLMERGKPGEVYNICNGSGYEVRAIAQGLVELATRPVALEVDAALVRAVDVTRLVGDPTKLNSATDWTPEIPLADTLEAVLRYERDAIR